MKKLTLYFLLTLFVNVTFGNTSMQKVTNSDSLNYYSKLANQPKSVSDLTKAFQFYKKMREESMNKNDTLSAVNHLKQIAKIQLKFGDYYGSESTLVMAKNFLDILPPNDIVQKSKIHIYIELGEICEDRMDYDLALKYFIKGLSLTRFSKLNTTLENNIAEIYLKQAKFDQSERLLIKTYENINTLGDSLQIARTLDNLGVTEGKLNRKSALYHLNKALNMRLQQGDKSDICVSYIHLSQYYKDKGDLKQAEAFANKAYLISETFKDASFREKALAQLISLRPNTTAYQYKTLKDSLETWRQLTDNEYASIRLDSFNQEKRDNEIKVEIEKERLKDLLFQTMGIIIFIIAVLIITMLHSKNQRDRLSEIYLTETRISKKLHDEVANDVYQVMAQLERDSKNKDEVLDALEDIYSRTRDISKENNSIALNEKFEEVLKDLLMRYHTKRITVITRNISKIKWEDLESIKKITLYRVLQELMINMKKHSQATIVAITFKFSGNKLTIKYSDNGVGCHLEKYSGLQNVENRIVSLDGNVNFVSRPGHGFKAEISI